MHYHSNSTAMLTIILLYENVILSYATKFHVLLSKLNIIAKMISSSLLLKWYLTTIHCYSIRLHNRIQPISV